MNRKIKYILLVSFWLFPGLHCTKYHNTADDLKGNNYIAGVAYLYNNFDANGISFTPFNNATVRIAYADSLNYLFSVQTDSSGGFIFPNLQTGTPYKIYAIDSISGVLFAGSIVDTLRSMTVPINDAVLNLYLDTVDQNGVIYTVTDSLGDIIGGCNVWIFSSAVLAAYSNASDTCYGCLYNISTNSFGKASQFGLAPGKYTTIFDAIFGADTLKGIDTSLIIQSSVLPPRTIVLHQQ